MESTSQRPKTDKEQKTKVYHLIEEYCNAFSFHDVQIGIWPQVEVYMNVYNEAPLVVCLYVIKD